MYALGKKLLSGSCLSYKKNIGGYSRISSGILNGLIHNITFMDYITRVRIRRAIELLRDDDHKMYEIAEAVGYSSQHYFSSAFKKVLGVSPMEYKKSLQKRGGPNP